MQSHRFSTNQKWTMASTSSGFALEHMDGMFISFAMTPLILSLGISNAAGGAIASVTNLGKLVGAVLFGMLADSYSRVKVFTYTIFLVAIATAAMYFANNIYLIYVIRFISGVGAGGEYGAGVTLVAENFRHRKIGTLMSYCAGIGNAGAILAACIAAAVLPTLGWHALFLFGLIPVVLAYYVRRHLKENPRFIDDVNERKRKHQQRARFSELFKTPRIAYQTVAIIVMALVESAGYYGLMSWLPSIMQKQMHLNISKSSLWMIVTIIGVTLGMIVFGKIMDNWGPIIAFSIFLVSAAAVMYLFTLAFNAITLMLAAAVVGFFAGGTYSGFGVVISHLYPMNIRVTANSFIESTGKAIGGLSPIVIGFLMDKYSLTTIMLCLSVLYLISLTVMFTIPNLKRTSNLN